LLVELSYNNQFKKTLFVNQITKDFMQALAQKEDKPKFPLSSRKRGQHALNKRIDRVFRL